MTCESNNRPRPAAAWTRRIRRTGILVLGTLLAASSGCTDAARNGEGDSYLVITTLQGGPGEGEGPLFASLASDVLNVDETTGEQTIFGDRGQASFQLVMKDTGGPGPSPVNAITLTQYRVEYIRADGRNTPGVDVPFPFDSGMTLTVTATGSSGFTLVRNQAKLEAPLSALRFSGGANIISTIARVTFFGHDQAGRGVSVTGNIEVNFADWGG
jgi:hypothetical protein